MLSATPAHKSPARLLQRALFASEYVWRFPLVSAQLPGKARRRPPGRPGRLPRAAFPDRGSSSFRPSRRRRTQSPPIGRLLIGKGGSHHSMVLEHPPDQLKSHRQPLAGEAAANAGGRLLGQVERIGERGPVDPFSIVIDLRRQLAGLEGGYWQGRRHQQVEARHELAHGGAKLAAAGHGAKIIIETYG